MVWKNDELSKSIVTFARNIKFYDMYSVEALVEKTRSFCSLNVVFREKFCEDLTGLGPPTLKAVLDDGKSDATFTFWRESKPLSSHPTTDVDSRCS